MRRLAVLVLPVMLMTTAVACDSPQRVHQKPGETLPPLPPTVAVRRTTTTVPQVTVTYVVQPGDTLSVISARLHVDESVLVKLNGIVDPDRLQAGQVLIVSAPPTTTPSSIATTSTLSATAST